MAGTPRQPHQETPLVTQDINVLALVKGEERYIFLYDDEHKSEALRTLGRFASNPELSFSWYDAAVLSQRIRQTALEQRRRRRSRPTVPAPPANRFKLPLSGITSPRSKVQSPRSIVERCIDFGHWTTDSGLPHALRHQPSSSASSASSATPRS